MDYSKSIVRHLISGGGWVLFFRIIATVSTLAISAFLTRLLPPDSVGSYFLISSIVVIGVQLCTFGTQQTVVKFLGGKFITSDSSSHKSTIKSCLIILSVASLITVTAYIGFGGRLLGNIFQTPLVAQATIITALWMLLRSLQLFLSQAFRGFHHIGLAALFDGTLTSAILVLLLATAWLTGISPSLRDILLITLGSLLLAITISGIYFFRLFQKAKDHQPVGISTILAVCYPLFIVSFALKGVAELHILILAGTNNEVEVAIYGAAFRLAKFVIFPLIIINDVIPPIIANLYANKRLNRLEEVLRVTATLATLPSLLIVIAISLLAGNFLGVIFGPLYVQGQSILILLLIGQLVNSATGSPGVFLSMTGHQQVVMRTALLSGVLGLFTSYALVHQFGGIGTAIGVTIGLVSHNSIMWMYCLRRMQIKTHFKLMGLKTSFQSLIHAKMAEDDKN